MDVSDCPISLLVPAKKLAWLFVAIDKMRQLHNGIHKWANEAEVSVEEASVLAEEFAEGNWPLTYPGDTPTPAVAKNWIETYWKPRHAELQSMRSTLRMAIPVGWYDKVDLHNVTIDS